MHLIDIDVYDYIISFSEVNFLNDKKYIYI